MGRERHDLDSSQKNLGQAVIDTFGQVVVINLPYRTDRRRDVDTQLRRIALNLQAQGVHLFPAIRPLDKGGFTHIGVRGCFLSHLAVLHMAMDNGWDRLLLLEDDVEFAPDVVRRINSAMQALSGKSWHMVLGGTPAKHDGVIVDAVSGLKRVAATEPLRQTHFMAFRGEAISRAVAYLELILTRPGGHPDGGPMDVDGAYNHLRAKFPDLITLLADPPLASQRASPTDVRPRKWFDRLYVLRPIVRWARAARRQLWH
jgi:glycosyl transferase, family 25